MRYLEDFLTFTMIFLLIGVSTLIYNSQISISFGFALILIVISSYISIFFILPTLNENNVVLDNNVKTIIYLDKNTFEAYVPRFDEKKVVAITIRDNEFSASHKINRRKFNVLDLCFEDNHDAFTSDHCGTIDAFLNDYLTNDIETIIVSCQMGVSRSPAIALALSFYLKCDIFPDVDTFNTHVFSVCQKYWKLNENSGNTIIR